jgi:hypothetical protein
MVVADAGQDKVFLIQTNSQFSKSSLKTSTLSVNWVQRVFMSLTSLVVIGKNTYKTKNIIFEYQLPDSAQLEDLTAFELTREYSISSNPIDSFMDANLFYLVVENLVFIIKHSVPKALVNDNTNLFSKQTWEGVKKLTALGNDSFLVHSHATSVIGKTDHVQPKIVCDANPFLEEGNYPLKVYVVASKCLDTETGETEYVCSKDLSLYIHAFVPFFSNPKIAFLIGAIIGVALLFLMSACYCYYYCKLRKDYEVLKEQSMSMSQYKYDSPNKKKEMKEIGTVLGEYQNEKEL